MMFITSAFCAILQSGKAGGYELPKVAEHVTSLPSKYKFTHTYSIVQYITEIFIRHTLSTYGKVAGTNLYFDGTQVYMVFARSFAAFSDS